MSNQFNMVRFSRLFLKHTIEHYRSYLMAILVLVGVMTLGGSFLVYMIEAPIDRGLQTAFFMMIMLVAGTIFTSTIFSDLGDREKAIPWLTLPASHFEKYLVAWLYSFPIFLITYTVVFYVVAFLAINLSHGTPHPPELINVFDSRTLELYLLYAFLHGITICGAIYFEKLHFIKTAFAFFVTVGLLILFNKFLLGQLIGRPVEAAPPFSVIIFMENTRQIVIDLKHKEQETFAVTLMSVTTVILWAVAFFRVREKQL